MRLDRAQVLRLAGGVRSTTFRSAGELIGAHLSSPGARFFDSTVRGRIAFGPGAGLVVGVSIGAESIRAALVDANGWAYHHHESDGMPGQLAAEPSIVIGRARAAAAQVLQDAFDKRELLVDGALPLLGWGVAWPAAIDRDRRPAGYVLTHHIWKNGQPLDQRIRLGFGVRDAVTYALNDAHAAAIAVAHRETHQKAHLKWAHPQLTLVLRLAGTIAGGVIVLEPKQPNAENGDTSGFVDSVLLGGVDNHAGQIGHAPVRALIVDELSRESSEQNESESPGPVIATSCSCLPRADERSPGHLEQYASVLALTQRLKPELPRGQALKQILEHPEIPLHHRGLTDVGALVGDALIGAVAVLNPAAIVLTGSLAVQTVHDEIERRLADGNTLGTLPAVDRLRGQENDFARATGAALALLRNSVHRRLDELLDDDRGLVEEHVRELTTPLESNPL